MNRFADPPYPGVRPFRHGDQGRFLGRATETATLAEMWRANHLTIMYGRAGSGKTSLLSAGVLPRLREDDLDVVAMGRLLTGSSYPRAALPSHNPFTLSLLSSWSPGGSASSLAGITVQEFVTQHSERSGRTVFAIIDQAEELFASTEPNRRARGRQFLRGLADALRESPHPPRLHLLISVRESAVDLFTAELGHGAQFHLGPFDYHAALDAVMQPLGRTSRSFAPGAAEKLVKGLMTGRMEAIGDGKDRSPRLDHVEPVLLQIVCARLWESLPDDVRTISEREICRSGDADVALAAYCGRVIAAVAASHGMPTAQLHAWLVRTFVTEMGTPGTAYEGLAGTAGMPNTVARAFEDSYLLTTERRSSATWYQLTERLVEPVRHATVTRPPPAGPDDYLRAAGRAYALGEFIPAKHFAEDALQALAGPDFRRLAQANSLLGNVAYERGRPAEAAKHYQAAAGLYEAVRDTAAVASQLAAVGQMLLVQGRISDAVDELRAAADRAPQDLAVQTKLGWALWEMGQHLAAIEVLSSVLAVDGSTAEAVRARGEILADLGHARDALRDLDRVQDEDDWPSARAARGLARAELGEPGAEKDIEGALTDAPRNGSVVLYAARAKALAGDTAAAVELARHALNATDPTLPQHQREAALQMAGENSPDCH